MFVIVGAKISKTDFNSQVGKGSRGDDFDGELVMIFLMSSTVIGVNESKELSGEIGRRGSTVLACGFRWLDIFVESSLSLISAIFFVKKPAKSSTASFKVEYDGRFTDVSFP